MGPRLREDDGGERLRDKLPRSRGAWRPSCSIDHTLIFKEGAGKTGCSPHPWSACNKKSTRQNHRYEPEQPAFPAQWCYGLYVLSPVTGLCCHRSLASSRET